jgi:anti-sigma factor RsiW
MQEYDDTGRRRLDPQGDDDWTTSTPAARRQAVTRRDAGVRQTRRISAWTAAALVAGVAASAGYFAHTAATLATGGTSATSVNGAVGATGQKPSLMHPVVTSGGSGVVAGATGGSAGTSSGAVHRQDN